MSVGIPTEARHVVNNNCLKSRTRNSSGNFW
jgi:hypothetical protein